MFGSYVQNFICRKEGKWQCGLVSKKYLEPTCDTDTSKFAGAFDALEIQPKMLKLIFLQTVLVTNAALPMCRSNWQMILNLTTRSKNLKSMTLQPVLLGQ